MPKGKSKKKTEEQELEAFLSNDQPPEEQPETAEKSPAKDQEDGQPYEVLEYAGRPLYRCKQCLYDAFNTEAVLEHIAKQHTPQPAEQTVLVADKHGKPVKGS